MAKRSSKAKTSIAGAGEVRQRGRRRLIKVLAFGGVAVTARSVPESWTQPVVEQVLLPAHAQMSPGAGPGGPGAMDETTDDVVVLPDTGL